MLTLVSWPNVRPFTFFSLKSSTIDVLAEHFLYKKLPLQFSRIRYLPTVIHSHQVQPQPHSLPVMNHQQGRQYCLLGRAWARSKAENDTAQSSTPCDARSLYTWPLCVCVYVCQVLRPYPGRWAGYLPRGHARCSFDTSWSASYSMLNPKLQNT